MISSAADRLATALLAHYPGWPVGLLNINALAQSLDLIGADIMDEVVDRAKVAYERPPSAAQLYEVARIIRLEHRRDDRLPALPNPVASEWPPEVAAKVHQLVGSVESPDSERNIEAENVDWEAKRQQVKAGLRLMGVCDGVGQPYIERDGKMVCPACGGEQGVGCTPRRAEA